MLEIAFANSLVWLLWLFSDIVGENELCINRLEEIGIVN